MTQQFIQGYSEYQLQAFKIPSRGNTKCIPQTVDYTKCVHKVGVINRMFGSCDQQFARFSRCHQIHVNYYSMNPVAGWNAANPRAFKEENVSPTLEAQVFNTNLLSANY